mgnify:CR=1 FL=1
MLAVIGTMRGWAKELLVTFGLVLALMGVGLSTLTGDPVWDAIGTICIGVLLVVYLATDVALAWVQNSALLLPAGQYGWRLVPLPALELELGFQISGAFGQRGVGGDLRPEALRLVAQHVHGEHVLPPVPVEVAEAGDGGFEGASEAGRRHGCRVGQGDPGVAVGRHDQAADARLRERHLHDAARSAP